MQAKFTLSQTFLCVRKLRYALQVEVAPGNVETEHAMVVDALEERGVADTADKPSQSIVKMDLC